jgi:hypothetical protein
MDGDMAALRLCLDRIIPPRKDRHVTLDLTSMDDLEDMARVSGTIVRAVAEGTITPGEGQALTGVLEVHRKTVEHADIEQRLHALETKQGVQK